MDLSRQFQEIFFFDPERRFPKKIPENSGIFDVNYLFARENPKFKFSSAEIFELIKFCCEFINSKNDFEVYNRTRYLLHDEDEVYLFFSFQYKKLVDSFVFHEASEVLLRILNFFEFKKKKTEEDFCSSPCSCRTKSLRGKKIFFFQRFFSSPHFLHEFTSFTYPKTPLSSLS